MVPVSSRRIVAVLVVVLGLAQALDSGLRHAPIVPAALVAAAIAATGAVFWLAANPLTHFIAGLVCIAVMFVARAISPVPLPTLALAGWFPCVAALLLQQAGRKGEELKSRG